MDGGVYTDIMTGARRRRQAGGRSLRCHMAARRIGLVTPMNAPLVNMIGMIGAVLTTVCWVPQAIKVIRSRETRAISLAGTVAFTIGIAFWLAYGLALGDWPLIASNMVTLALMAPILALKLRHG
jgi:MtN3 and saliva related transmembrane protein